MIVQNSANDYIKSLEQELDIDEIQRSAIESQIRRYLAKNEILRSLDTELQSSRKFDVYEKFEKLYSTLISIRPDIIINDFAQLFDKKSKPRELLIKEAKRLYKIIHDAPNPTWIGVIFKSTWPYHNRKSILYILNDRIYSMTSDYSLVLSLDDKLYKIDPLLHYMRY
jgi:hypothetical protein